MKRHHRMGMPESPANWFWLCDKNSSLPLRPWGAMEQPTLILGVFSSLNGALCPHQNTYPQAHNCS